MSNIADITPPYEPISLAREMVERAGEGDCVGAVVILIRKDGSIWKGSCGHEARDVLWALQRMIFDLMDEGRGE